MDVYYIMEDHTLGNHAVKLSVIKGQRRNRVVGHWQERHPGTAHSLITDHNTTTYPFKATKIQKTRAVAQNWTSPLSALNHLSHN